MTLRVLALGYSFPPAAAPEAWCSAKALGSLPDASVDVVTATPQGRIDHSIDDWIAPRFRRITRLPWPAALARIPTERLGLPLNVPDAYRLLAPLTRTLLRSRDPRTYDVLVSRSQPHSSHLVAARLSRRTGLPWVACLSDPWSTNPFLRSGRLTAWANRRLERDALGAASGIVVTSADAIEAVLGHLPAGVRSRAAVVPHAWVPDLYPRAARDTAGPKVIRHVGSFYRARSPGPLFRALRRLLDRRPELAGSVALELVGTLQARYRGEAAAVLPAGTVRHVPSADHRAALGLMAKAAVLVTVDAPMERSPFLPSKLVDYVGAGRPVVALAPEGPARALTRSLGGWVADPSDTEGGADALEAALGAAAAGRPFGDEKVQQRYRADTVGAALQAVLEKAAESR